MACPPHLTALDATWQVPIFHTEHCIFANRLSNGNSYKDCGHPCTRHSLHLVDERQNRHHVLADSGCRNTVFNAQPQSAAPYVGMLRRAGVRHLRVELTDQPGSIVAPLLERYAALARGGDDEGSESAGAGAGGGGERVSETRLAEEMLEWLEANLIDSTGHKPGATTGSFKPSAERAWATLRPTAAAERARRK